MVRAEIEGVCSGGRLRGSVVVSAEIEGVCSG